jgi:hypothetical protein
LWSRANAGVAVNARNGALHRHDLRCSRRCFGRRLADETNVARQNHDEDPYGLYLISGCPIGRRFLGKRRRRSPTGPRTVRVALAEVRQPENPGPTRLRNMSHNLKSPPGRVARQDLLREPIECGTTGKK